MAGEFLILTQHSWVIQRSVETTGHWHSLKLRCSLSHSGIKGQQLKVAVDPGLAHGKRCV